MAKDVSNKQVSSSNSGNTSPSIPDQQKVPPLRIVLNTSGNQKSPSTGIAVAANQQQDLKREKPQDAKADNILKGTTGRVRIKLGTNKQVSKSASASGNESSNKVATEEAQKQKSALDRKESIVKEEITANYSHLRRITRRSQKSAQTVNAEDEESVSSMTSTDENQNTSNNNNSDNNNVQDAATTSSQSNCSSSTANVISSNSSSNSETPRRYKRRKGETNESSLNDQYSLFGYQNYKLPSQNSFELYKNIRKQVDKKLDNLSSIHLKTPRGFRDYMLTRGTYLLDGNRLGNGTNLFMNEDGGLYSIPLSKYHALRASRVNYSVPNRAKVPLGLPVNSPLYNLFIEQEKDRYRMRMQHIKEREKLTLAAEQEILRVYNQAAMTAANQNEPFSACTMLKHQEIYNYMDSDGVLVQASDDIQQDEVKQDEGNSRRRNSEQGPNSPTRRNSNTEDYPIQLEGQKDPVKTLDSIANKDDLPKNEVDSVQPSAEEDLDKNKEKDESSEATAIKSTRTTSEKSKQPSTSSSVIYSSELNKNAEKGESKSEEETKDSDSVKRAKTTKSEKTDGLKAVKGLTKEGSKLEMEVDSKKSDLSSDTHSKMEVTEESKSNVSDDLKVDAIKDDNECEKQKSSEKINAVDVECKSGKKDSQNTHDALEVSVERQSGEACDTEMVAMEEVKEDEKESSSADELVLSDDVKQSCSKENFLSQLRDIDDKWDRIRGEMLIRHRNEAESLYAVQKLEWEWKTKEIGACDVRVTPIIDTMLVPKLSIYSQDY